MVAAGGADDRTRSRAIKDPEDALGEGREQMEGVDPGFEARNKACT